MLHCYFNTQVTPFNRHPSVFQAIADKEKAAKGKDKKDRSKSPAKGKGGKKTPEPPTAKEGSKLRKRGEEDNDNKYIGE